MITTKQQTIARQEAKNIVREYLDSQDEGELEEGIYEAIIEALKHSANTPVRQSLPSDVYTELDIDKAYKCGERQSTFYKKNGTVILPRNYEGIDG